MAARDMVIDFGKYKGTMLGTLPSKYLRWLCKNLRAGDYLEWAKRADEVLEDPVYLDRIEWEQADALLTGNSNIRVEYPISHRLLELSQRFEWDNDNADGWKRIDFSLLGTSKGARIPRIRDRKGFSSHNTMLRRQSNVGSAQMMDREVFPLKNNLGSAHMRDGEVFSSKRDEGFTQTRNIEVFSSKKNKGSSHIGSRVPHGADGEESGLREELLRRRREGRRGRQRFRNEELRASGDGLEEKSALGGVFNPFPGRESLLMKMNIIPP
ncbi:hypothetical protein AMTRI_Chr07g28080 [Amborella trichopoda]|uniref:Uncharacterized protein n=2 Tax=Amborella trichopoda TaxID=13333 RepID=W1PAV4_AMBTC|nr:hypothetical protein AMTR_s00076p00187720 [Amborella trichopoda]